MPFRKWGRKSLKLRSRGNQVVYVQNERDRDFLEQADELVVKLNRRLDNKPISHRVPKKNLHALRKPARVREKL